jgi:hypothetical protein
LKACECDSRLSPLEGFAVVGSRSSAIPSAARSGGGGSGRSLTGQNEGRRPPHYLGHTDSSHERLEGPLSDPSYLVIAAGSSKLVLRMPGG